MSGEDARRDESLAAGLRDLERSHRGMTWLEVEPLMTDGYARVLALEAERLRVRRELVGLAGSPQTADQAASLTSELDVIGTELSSLRTSLSAVRRCFAREDALWPRTATG
jgi:hypothetical protein